MEYLIKEQLEKLQEQRSTLIYEIKELNENLPNYNTKIMELNNQIVNIDMLTRDLVLSYKDVKIIELQNELTIKQLNNK